MVLIKILLPALAYYVAGSFGLLLAIPPGFASAVWPAAGVALACMLIRPGPWTLLGIMLGSFSVNLGVSSEGLNGLNLAALLTPGMIALGAALQAAAGAWLYRLSIGETRVLDNPTLIGRFVLWIGPVGCLTGASVGTFTLYYQGFVDLSNTTFTWFTWWAGDTIGTILFTPLLTTLLTKDERVTPLRKWQIGVPSSIIFLVITLLFIFSTRTRQHLAEEEIYDNAQRFFRNSGEKLHEAENQLNAYTALYHTASHITRDQFEQFSRNLIHSDSIFYAVGWTPVVFREQRPALEQAAQTDGLQNFELTEFDDLGNIQTAKTRDIYYPVYYIYPRDKNQLALGLDLGTNQERLDALERARDTRSPAATAPISLAQDSGTHKALILYLPVFDSTYTNPSTPGGKLEGPILRGYISGVFRVDGIFNKSIQEANQNHYGVTISDITNPDKPIELLPAPQVALQHFTPIIHTRNFGGRTLQCTFYASPSYQIASKDWTSWSILTFGFLLAALFQSFMLLITGTAENTQREVILKTKELELAKNAAITADRAKTHFLANMSHELRTPLNAVTGLITLCLKTDMLDPQRAWLFKARLAANTLMSLINHTLDYSKLEAGKLSTERIEFGLCDILEKINAIFYSHALEKGIDFKFHLPEKLPMTLIGDPLRIEQVLLNLCGNALKFTTKGSVTLAVFTDRRPNQILSVTFEVQDTGIGISEEAQAHLFHAFQQADSSTTRQYGGTGLGLVISKQLVELMGGEISLNSVTGQGTRITVALPLTCPAHDQGLATDYLTQSQNGTSQTLAEKNSAPASAIKEDQVLAGKTLLLVEDIEINREIATYILEDFGATVITAVNGLDALRVLAQTPQIDLILMDLQMPEMDGYEATQKIRMTTGIKHIPIIAMTANAVASDIAECKAAGMNEHIGKPIDEVEMMRKIMEHVL